MRSKKILITVSAALIAAVLLTLFIPVKKQYTARIPLPIERTVAQLAAVENVQKWFTPFTQSNPGSGSGKASGQWELTSGDYSLKIAGANSFYVALSFSNKSQTAMLNFQVNPDSGYMDMSRITLTVKRNIWGAISGRNELLETAIANLSALETYTGNNRRLYGLDIKHELVKDSAYLYTKRTIGQTGLGQTASTLCRQLTDFANKNHLEIAGSPIINIKQVGTDSTQVSAGLPIHTYIYLAPGNIIQYRQMPFGKKLLEAPFKGGYRDLPAAFDKLKSYADDHRLTIMAIPYAKYTGEQIDFADGDLIDFTVYFPVD
ncbi:hypothetical protein [Flavihumibacter petaseus]|uniref:Uncharacterized protein n=1 Tax=Flavihumibacter petaseus NBRC 106054 TaxID=1220578 RepID=A0A0E9N6S8_9BACT|nr:hypothetical protein [Flavihumibacter petaseus]GAO45050.1 hypothetical protein FPE01S_04_02930 [Flavihumibacter petaseus NBRC 106054]